ncbi:uroporphyrinogen III methyltransferase [Streptomyces spiroverticillatus]|uniref:Uroporphyrinogen III methyltransferase n=1 Tax=Streptomyces finlayi TaxID=67296 RepID=A0A919C9F7_9ACTN|nr:uroporphyrinogen-III synthase [Streptomyces finlayi]GHA08219.1 uroporphyrinogen III methyltransferase [Streptomyces spiroverticillatus]GHC91268.1 uroporphyrinogen III methyltransferase [Streptomyces finlayi]
MTTATPATPVPPEGSLTGLTVGVTADRRRDELEALLRRRGAKVLSAPALRIVPIDDDALVRDATDACLARPLDYVVATTGVGWRGWISAAEGWGTGARLVEACRGATVISRGPKATGAIRASGLRESYAPASEAVDEMLAWLLDRDLAGKRVAVQEHGAPLPEFTAALRERGAEVVEVPVYRWGPAADPDAVRRLVEATVRGEVHALPFTSAPAIDAFLATADGAGRRTQVLDALRTHVLAACIGPVCARPLLAADVPCVWPERGRLGALVRTLDQELPHRHRHQLATAEGNLTVQDAAVWGPEGTVHLTPLPTAILRALAEHPGTVLSRAELLRRAWPADTPDTPRPTDEHVVEAAVGRLRSALGPYSKLIRTVTKRGYRLAVDPG